MESIEGHIQTIRMIPAGFVRPQRWKGSALFASKTRMSPNASSMTTELETNLLTFEKLGFGHGSTGCRR